jgi:hypothetical protein
MPPLLIAALAASTFAHHPPCNKTFTYHMDTRAAWAVYTGTHDVSTRNVRMLRRIARCQRRRHNVRRARIFNAARRGEWADRRYQEYLDSHMTPAIASWYDTHGIGACGVDDVQNGYRFASLFLACGTAVKFCHYGACIVGVMEDHGPYVSGRSFDFNVNMKYALGCGGICAVTYRIL